MITIFFFFLNQTISIFSSRNTGLDSNPQSSVQTCKFEPFRYQPSRLCLVHFCGWVPDRTTSQPCLWQAHSHVPQAPGACLACIPRWHTWALMWVGQDTHQLWAVFSAEPAGTGGSLPAVLHVWHIASRTPVVFSNENFSASAAFFLPSHHTSARAPFRPSVRVKAGCSRREIKVFLFTSVQRETL